ncbi:hypothetical protein D3C75_1196950 [compost metagenome]
MTKRQQPARLARFERATATAVDHPAAHLDFAPCEAAQCPLVELRQPLRFDAQHQRPVQLQPDPAAVTLERRDPPAQHGKPRAAQLADLEYRIPAPDTLAR